MNQINKLPESKSKTGQDRTPKILSLHRRLFGIWNWLVNPKKSYQNQVLEQKSRLLSIFLLVMILIYFVVDIASSHIANNMFLYYLGYILMISAFFINRNFQYFPASRLTTAIVPYLIFSSVFSKSAPNPVNLLDFLVLGLLLGSFLQKKSGVLLIGLINIIGILLTPSIASQVEVSFLDIIPPLVINTLSTVLIVLYMSHHEMIEKEQQPLDSDAKFRSIYKNSPLGIMFAEGGSVLIDVNQGVCRLLGYSKAELIGKKIPDLVHPEDRDKINKGFLRLVTDLTPAFKMEVRFLNKNGEIIWVNLNITLLYDNTGFPTHGIGIIEDITQRIIAKTILQESERDLQEAQRIANLGSWINNYSTKEITWSEQVYQIFGYDADSDLSPAEIIDQHLHPDDKELYKNLLSGKRLDPSNIEFIDFPYRIISPTGDIRHLITSGEYILDEGEEKIGARGTVLDVTRIVEAEENLRESEIRFRSIYENSPLGTLMISPSNQILEANPSFCEMLNYTNSELLLMGMSDITHQDDKSETVKIIRQAINDRSDSFQLKQRLLTKDGDSVWINFTGTLMYDQDGNITAGIGITENITKRRKADLALKESIKKFRGFMDQSTDGISIIDQEGKITEWSKGLEEITEISANTAIGKYIWDIQKGLVPSALRTKARLDRSRLVYKEYLQAGVDNLESSVMDAEIEIRSGERRFLQVATFPIQTEQGMMFGGIHRDITERKKVADALELEEEKFKIIFESAPDAYYITDLKGMFIDGNKAAERITGYGKEELIGKSFLQLNMLSKNQLPTAAALLVKNNLGRPTGPDEFTLIRKNGSEIEVEISTHPVNIEGKTVVLGIARDITERKQTEQALLDSEYLLRESQEVALLGSYKLDIQSGYWESSQVLDDLFGIDEKYNKDIQSWMQIIHPNDHVMMQEYFATNVLENQESFNKEYRIQRINDNQVRWVHGLGKLEISDEGIPLKMIGTIQDITERKQAEMALRENEFKYRNLVESSPDGIITLSKTGQVLSVNESFSKLTGFEKSDFVGKSFLKAPTLLKQDRDFFTRLVKDVFQGKIKGTIEFNWKHANGEIRNGEAKASFLKVEDKIVGIQGIIRDITERKKTETKLKETENRFRKLMENSPDAIQLLTTEGKIEHVNDSYLKLFGISDEILPEIIDKYNMLQDEQIIKLGLMPLVEKAFAGDVIKIPPTQYDATQTMKLLEFTNSEGKKPWLQSQIYPIKDENGNILNIVCVHEDITEQKQSEIILKRQLDELHILQKISAICIENVDEDQIISQVTNIMGNELYTDHFGVMLLDEKDNVLRIHPSYQGLVPEDADFEFKLGEGVVGRVAKTNKPLRINDVTQDEKYIAPKHCQSSELCVPISVNSKVFGVINAESSRLNAFTSEDERLLITVADQLAVALQKSRLYQSEQKGRLEAEANREASEFLTMSLDLDEVLDNILDSLRKVIDTDQASIHLFEQDLVHVVAGKGFKNIDEVIGYKYSIENQLVLEIVNSKLPLVLEDTVLDSRFQHYGPENPRAWMGTPLIERETVFGYLSVENNIPGTFNQRDAKLVQIFANNAAAAIVKARLFEGEKKRRLEAEIQGEISTALTDTYNLKTFLEKGLRNLQRYLNYDSAGILLEEDGHIRIVATLGFPEPDKINNLCISKDNQLYQEILKTKSVLILKDTEQDDRFEDIGAEVDIRGWMGIPLIDQGVVYGYVSFDSKTPGKFTPEMGRLAQVLVNQTSSAIIKTKLFEETQLGLKRLEALHEIDRIITSSVELSFSIKQILQIVVSQLDIDAANVVMYDSNSLIANYVSSVGFHNRSLNQRNHQIGNEFTSRVVLERKIVWVEGQDELKNLFGLSSDLILEGFTAYVGVPLIAKGEIKGVLELFQRSPLHTDSKWEGFLQTLATQLAIAIDNSLMFENLQKSHLELTLSYDATIEGWAQALEMRDMETEGHCRRVVDLTQDLARLMGIDGMELAHIRRGALLHDIGKMAVPDVILQKTGKLTDEEWKIMRQHPVYAMEWLSSTKYLIPALDIPYCHHEKWDGSGYPQGLEGEDIPLSARIFAIVDVWDALRSDRPYRKAWSKRKTIQYIQDQSGKHFDPGVVNVFSKIIEEDKKLNQE